MCKNGHLDTTGGLSTHLQHCKESLDFEKKSKGRDVFEPLSSGLIKISGYRPLSGLFRRQKSAKKGRNWLQYYCKNWIIKEPKNNNLSSKVSGYWTLSSTYLLTGKKCVQIWSSKWFMRSDWRQYRLHCHVHKGHFYHGYMTFMNLIKHGLY